MTLSSRETMLANIRSSLASNRPWLEAEANKASHVAPPFVLPPADDLVAQFVGEVTQLEGKTYRCSDDEEALEAIDALLQEKQATTVIAWERDQIGLAGLDALLNARQISVTDGNVNVGDARKARLQALEPAQVCISGSDVGIAESGTLVLLHGPGKPRIASLLAPAHIAVIRSSQLVRGLGEAIGRLREQHGAGLFDDTSNLTFITGPSRTADIEMTLALGIHGPREIHVVVIEDE